MTQPLILVTGGTGQVGTALAGRASDCLPFDFIMPDRAALDLEAEKSIEAWFADRAPAAVINCAAYTAVDKAESEPARAWAVNAAAPGLIAARCGRLDIPLVHISTDYVFDGSKQDSYVESDPIAPLGVYGASKEAGERAVQEACPRHVILRTAWVISPWGANFVKTILRLGGERTKLGIVHDQIGCPTSADDIAGALVEIAGRLIENKSAPFGTYHFVNAGKASWYDLARAVFTEASARGMSVPALEAIATENYPTPARRPRNSRLATGKIAEDYGIVARPWRDALADILDRLLPPPIRP